MYNSDSSAASSDVSNSMCVTKELIEKMLGKEATALETLLSKVRLLLITDHNTAPIPHICHQSHQYICGEKKCHVEKFQISMHDKCGDF